MLVCRAYTVGSVAVFLTKRFPPEKHPAITDPRMMDEIGRSLASVFVRLNCANLRKMGVPKQMQLQQVNLENDSKFV